MRGCGATKHGATAEIPDVENNLPVNTRSLVFFERMHVHFHACFQFYNDETFSRTTPDFFHKGLGRQAHLRCRNSETDI